MPQRIPPQDLTRPEKLLKLGSGMLVRRSLVCAAECVSVPHISSVIHFDTVRTLRMKHRAAVQTAASLRHRLSARGPF